MVVTVAFVSPAAAAVADAAAPVKGDLLNASYYPSRADAANVTKNWYIIDAKGQTLGRLATLVATYIRYTWMQNRQPAAVAKLHAGHQQQDCRNWGQQ